MTDEVRPEDLAWEQATLHDGISIRVPWMVTTWVVHGVLVRVVDGDTVVADLDLGWRIWLRNVSIRLAGINAPEMDTAAGKTARNALLTFVDAPITVVSHKLDKYGRILASVRIESSGLELSQHQLDSGNAVPYNP